MRRRTAAPDDVNAAIGAFLDTHYARTHPDDVGALLGQLTLLRQTRRADASDRRRWNEAVSHALAGIPRARLH